MANGGTDVAEGGGVRVREIVRSLTANTISPVEDPVGTKIVAGIALGEVDVNADWNAVWGEEMIAIADASYYNNSYAADLRATALLDEGSSAVVIEHPPGRFATVPIADVGADIATHESAACD